MDDKLKLLITAVDIENMRNQTTKEIDGDVMKLSDMKMPIQFSLSDKTIYCGSFEGLRPSIKKTFERIFQDKPLEKPKIFSVGSGNGVIFPMHPRRVCLMSFDNGGHEVKPLDIETYFVWCPANMCDMSQTMTDDFEVRRPVYKRPSATVGRLIHFDQKYILRFIPDPVDAKYLAEVRIDETTKKQKSIVIKHCIHFQNDTFPMAPGMYYIGPLKECLLDFYPFLQKFFESREGVYQIGRDVMRILNVSEQEVSNNQVLKFHKLCIVPYHLVSHVPLQKRTYESMKVPMFDTPSQNHKVVQFNVETIVSITRSQNTCEVIIGCAKTKQWFFKISF
jgi:hypothetical protein